MQPRRFLLLADNPLTLAQLRAEIEDLGEETRCQTALTAEEALFRLSQESVDAVLLLPCPAADCLTQSLLRHPPLAAPFLLGSGRRAAGNFAAAGVVLRASSARAGGGTSARMHRTGTSAADGAGDAADAPSMGIPAGNGGADGRASVTADRRDARLIPADGAPRAADPVRRRAAAAPCHRINMESRRLRCDCALLRAVGRPRTRQAHESGVSVPAAGAIDAQREEDGEKGGVKMRHLRLFSASDMPGFPLQAHTIAVFFIATAMTPAVIASAAQNASHTPVMPKSAAITSAQSTIAATPRRMDVIIAHFAAPTALR